LPVQKFTEVTALPDHTSDILTNWMPMGRLRVEVTTWGWKAKQKGHRTPSSLELPGSFPLERHLVP